MCFHVSLRSILCGIADPLNDTSGQLPLLNAKVICADFRALTLIFQIRNQLSIRRSSACRSCEASSLDELVANIAVSFVTGRYLLPAYLPLQGV